MGETIPREILADAGAFEKYLDNNNPLLRYCGDGIGIMYRSHQLWDPGSGALCILALVLLHAGTYLSASKVLERPHVLWRQGDRKSVV